MTIGWQPEMATGSILLDAGRRALVERADALLAALESNAGKPALEKALRELGDASVRHFSHSEDCQLRGLCPALEWNGQARVELIAIVNASRSGYERAGAGPALADELACGLSEWVSRYIPGPDTMDLPCRPR
jgi:hypothetical protein